MAEKKLQGVPDTLYIPLTARIYASRRFPSYFYDAKSLSIEDALPNDSIARRSNEYVQMASVARYYNLDQMVRSFMDEHGRCNIINLGAGLETAYFRLQPPQSVTFYEVDFPEVIAERRRVLGDSPNEVLLGSDLFDLDWANRIDTELPSLLTASGVFQYCHQEQVLGFIAQARGRFARAELIFDATNRRGLAYANRYVRRTGNTQALMRFSLNDGRAERHHAHRPTAIFHAGTAAAQAQPFALLPSGHVGGRRGPCPQHDAAPRAVANGGPLLVLPSQSATFAPCNRRGHHLINN